MPGDPPAAMLHPLRAPPCAAEAMDTTEKLNMALDDIGGGRRRGARGPQRVVRGGRPPRGAADDDDFVPYRNTGGTRHLAGASLQQIAAASDAERCEAQMHFAQLA